ncbi:MAG: lipopolysaccharide biosynthesis protein [Gemmatimonadales bacterium]
MNELWRSPTLRSVVIYAVSGIGFVGANLLLARLLPTGEYGLFTLVVALIHLGYALASSGLDGVVNRRHLEAGPWLFRRSLGAALMVGMALTLVAGITYQLKIPMLLAVLVSTAAGGAMMVAAAKFQSEQRFGISLALSQSPNFVLILAALAVALSHQQEAWLPVLISAAGFVVAAILGWQLLFRERGARPGGQSSFSWGEAFSFAGLNAAGTVLVQLDRLIIPQVLSVHDLATYGVLAAIAGSMFRVLSMGVGYTMVPRLRAADGILERRRLIGYEAKLVGAIVVAGSVVIWFITPLLEAWFLAGKYQLAGSLVLAVLVAGTAKIANAFTKAIVSALATPGELSLVNLLGWGSVALAVLAGVLGARWGLVGVIYGVALGWVMRALAYFFIALRHLKLPATVPAPAR